MLVLTSSSGIGSSNSIVVCLVRPSLINVRRRMACWDIERLSRFLGMCLKSSSSESEESSETRVSRASPSCNLLILSIAAFVLLGAFPSAGKKLPPTGVMTLPSFLGVTMLFRLLLGMVGPFLGDSGMESAVATEFPGDWSTCVGHRPVG